MQNIKTIFRTQKILSMKRMKTRSMPKKSRSETAESEGEEIVDAKGKVSISKNEVENSFSQFSNLRISHVSQMVTQLINCSGPLSQFFNAESSTYSLVAVPSTQKMVNTIDPTTNQPKITGVKVTMHESDLDKICQTNYCAHEPCDALAFDRLALACRCSSNSGLFGNAHIQTDGTYKVGCHTADAKATKKAAGQWIDAL